MNGAMKRALPIVVAGMMLAGCQHQQQEASQQPTMDQRQEIARKLIVKGLNDLQNKDLKSCIVDLETSIKIDPTQPEGYLLLGQILLKLQQYDHASDFLDQAAKVLPDNGTIFYMLAVADQMDGKKLPAALAARHSVEIFQNQQDRDNMLKSAALLHDIVSMPDDSATASAPAASNQTPPTEGAGD